MKRLLFILLLAFSVQTVSSQDFDLKKQLLPANYSLKEKQNFDSKKRKELPIVNPLRISQLPHDFVVPAEYEETQAVCMAWPYVDNPITQTRTIVLDRYFAGMFGDMANAIQEECPVWIRVEQPADTTRIISFLRTRNTPLRNYRFFHAPGDAFWIRDYGPVGFYHGSEDSLAFLDLAYYDARPYDDVYPQFLGEKLGMQVFTSSLNTEGGNFMTDGFGTVFYSTRIIDDNSGLTGLPNKWEPQRVRDTIQNVYGGINMLEMTSLQCDGGTGHIDMYMKLINEETLIMTRYPEQVNAIDREIIDENIKTIQNATTIYNRPYKIHFLEMPTNDDGQIVTECEDINDDARGYINGLIVNKSFIYPSYSNVNSGNELQDERVNERIKKLMPGYKIVPIDARQLTVLAGALHCITMQIPADNPIRFWHPSLQHQATHTLGQYPLEAEITNRSGIKSAKCFWRKKGENQWRNFDLIGRGTTFTGGIPNVEFVMTDTIEYYLWAESNNGKTMTKPFVAPEGYYSFGFPVNTNRLPLKDQLSLRIMPNPASDYLHVSFNAEIQNQKGVKLVIRNALGQLMETFYYSNADGRTESKVDIQTYSSGVYHITILQGDQIIDTKRFSVLR